jgi:hypothetical protein
MHIHALGLRLKAAIDAAWEEDSQAVNTSVPLTAIGLGSSITTLFLKLPSLPGMNLLQEVGDPGDNLGATLV